MIAARGKGVAADAGLDHLDRVALLVRFVLGRCREARASAIPRPSAMLPPSYLIQLSAIPPVVPSGSDAWMLLTSMPGPLSL